MMAAEHRETYHEPEDGVVECRVGAAVLDEGRHCFVRATNGCVNQRCRSGGELVPSHAVIAAKPGFGGVAIEDGDSVRIDEVERSDPRQDAAMETMVTCPEVEVLQVPEEYILPGGPGLLPACGGASSL